jgi:hypothetical protein
MWVLGYYHINFLTIKVTLLKQSFTSSFTKLTTVDATPIQVQMSFTKTKTQN